MISFEQTQAFARKCQARWEANKDGRFEVETTMTLATQAGTISKSYPGVKVLNIDAEGATIEFEADTKHGVPLWVCLSFGVVSSFSDMTALMPKLAPSIAKPTERKIAY
jgi:hypothetical protein